MTRFNSPNAAAEETSPRVIIAQWIADRTRYEASQKEAA
jgi:hypothetical protein